MEENRLSRIKALHSSILQHSYYGLPRLALFYCVRYASEVRVGLLSYPFEHHFNLYLRAHLVLWDGVAQDGDHVVGVVVDNSCF